MNHSHHERTATLLSELDDSAFLVEGGKGIGGRSGTIEVDGARVFVKRIPLTDQELTRTTADVFAMPLHTQYGIGSPGRCAWRELEANELVTEAVLAGRTTAFPVLHHWRVLPDSPPPAECYEEIHEALRTDPVVQARAEALATASHSLVLASEYVPGDGIEWLKADPVARAEPAERQLAEIADVLRELEILHLDGHFGNIRVADDRLYLADFGLATSTKFELSAEERAFYDRNEGHDFALMALHLSWHLMDAACGVPRDDRGAYLASCATTGVPADVPPAVAGVLTRHAPAASQIHSFYKHLFAGEFNAEPPRFPAKL